MDTMSSASNDDVPALRAEGRVHIASRLALGAAMAASIGALFIARDRTPELTIAAVVGVLWSASGFVLSSGRAERERCVAVGPLSGIALCVSLVALGSAWRLERRLEGVTDVLSNVIVHEAPALGAAVLVHLVLGMPDGRVPRRLRDRALPAAYAVAAIIGIVGALVGRTAGVLLVALLWAAALSALPLAAARYRAAPTVEQRRLQWVGLAVAVVAEVVLVSTVLTVLADWPHRIAAVGVAATGLIPLALVASVRPRMAARVDRLLTHTVSAIGLTALVGVAYFGALAAFGRRPAGSERSVLLLSMAAACVVAIAYQPTRSRVEERANRIVYGERVSPDEALRTWGSRLTRAIPLDELLLQLAETLRKSMQLRAAEIWTGGAGRYEVVASVPHRSSRTWIEVAEKGRAVVARAGVSGGTWLEIWLPDLVDAAHRSSSRVAPIAHSGQLLGLIVCTRAPGADAFTDEDDRVLTELARQVGLALHNAELDNALRESVEELRRTNDELRASRSRIVVAGDAERRKLERNLHDGAQQHLVALAVKLRLAKDAIEDEPGDAQDLLDEIRSDLQLAVGELRALAHGIFPPLLMSGGLGEALPAAASRAALPTTAEIDGIGRYGAELEAAVYFCCSEALQNAGKYAGEGAEAALRVWEDAGLLHWQVSDTGAGFDPSAIVDVGHGFVNMRDRMGAFGGAVTVTSSSGAGTTIHGQVPC